VRALRDSRLLELEAQSFVRLDTIGLRQWSAIHVAIEAGRRAATQTLEAGGADALRAVLDARV
jgi:hypothetical protein